MVSFEIFVKAMPPSLSQLKVLPSFCFALKIPGGNYLRKYGKCIWIKLETMNAAYLQLNILFQIYFWYSFDIRYLLKFGYMNTYLEYQGISFKYDTFKNSILYLTSIWHSDFWLKCPQRWKPNNLFSQDFRTGWRHMLKSWHM